MGDMFSCSALDREKAPIVALSMHTGVHGRWECTSIKGGVAGNSLVACWYWQGSVFYLPPIPPLIIELCLFKLHVGEWDSKAAC